MPQRYNPKRDSHALSARRVQLRALAIHDLQMLLGAEPELARAFRVLAKSANSRELRTFCREGVTYTRRRVIRIKQALKLLGAPVSGKHCYGLSGLIKDAKRVALRRQNAATDAALLGAIERISHFGLAIYTTIDRYLRGAGAPGARRILIPSTKEKRDAIGEMSRMTRNRLLPRLSEQ
jgi:ferritin-like metal-binding protein YciE